MTRSVIRISKATVKAWAASFVTLIAVGLIALVIVEAVPSTPFAQIHHFLDINNNNPAIYNSGLFQDNAPVANFLDSIVITGIAFFIAGLPYGWIAARKDRRVRPVLLGGAVCALVFSALIVGIGWLGVVALSRITYLQGGMVPPTVTPNALYWETGAVQVALWTAAFLAGTFLMARLPRRAAITPPKQAPVA